MRFDECLAIIREENFVEFRFDLLDLSSDQVSELVGASQRSIATFRPDKHAPEWRLETMITALKAGANYADIEMDADPDYTREIIKTARKYGRDVIISYHNFDCTPELSLLREIVSSAKGAGADVVKIACQVNQIKDIHSLLALYQEEKRMVSIGMGEKGVITRVAAPFLGAEFTFASPGAGQETAPGQIDRKRLSSIIDQINGINLSNKS